MARLKDKDLKPLYEAAERFVEVALRGQDSLFTPGNAVWSDATIQDLYHRFVEQPDYSKRSFELKLQEQLSGAPPETYQLAGEILYVHFLPGKSTGGERKRDVLNTVLGWSPDPVQIPPELAKALDKGLAAEGVAFRIRRPDQLAYLLLFIRKWKTLSDQERSDALKDPWAFKEVVFSVPIHGARSQAEILLHLVHPDSFEAIMSQQHKEQIAEAFKGLVEEPTDDVERKLLQIRRKLGDQYGLDFRFYSPELIMQWNPKADPWTYFVRFAKAFYELPGFDESERDYKLRIAEQAKPVIEALRREINEDHIEQLQKVLRHREQNFVRWQDFEPLLQWCRREQTAAYEAISAVSDSARSSEERIRAFTERLPKEIVKNSASRTTLAGFFLFCHEPTEFPPFRFKPFDRGCQWTGFPKTSHKEEEAQRYMHALSFLDRMI
jgi:5-methylcytosine-specific restriction enzyme B